ncbi:MAG: bifunctional glutamate N-acetyltransferase/amino-acid acetyltransferase ArgJ [Treponema sp.]|nr:bifunctional glutamate N-acetyltransferase/amino-acid acetyltransferase ArgJ [Treponema sp.]
MKELHSGVCAPKGFRAGGIWCGIKADSRKRDLALIYSERPCVPAAMFTANTVKGASLLVTREHVAVGRLHAIIANSGNANTCTGDAGIKAARRTAALIADEFAISAKSVAVASTGVIGVPLPIAAIESEISSLADSLCGDAAGHNAALEAIMTTDTRKKDGAIEIELSGVPVRIGAMAKGSGMIHPNMATMLCFITTDANVSREALEKALRKAVSHSFNRLTVDGDMSTNDMTLILANGAAGNPPVATENADFAVFSDALESLCVSLARKMARDGEGATRLLTVAVRGATDEAGAEALAKSVASSSLVKTAIFGADANWGRALCALGYAGVDFDPEKVDMWFASRVGSVLVCKDSRAAQFSEEEAKKILSEEEVEINIDLTGDFTSGASGAAVVWGCDLTYDYVKINGEYRS